jgi:hypothetical protein
VLDLPIQKPAIHPTPIWGHPAPLIQPVQIGQAQVVRTQAAAVIPAVPSPGNRLIPALQPQPVIQVNPAVPAPGARVTQANSFPSAPILALPNTSGHALILPEAGSGIQLYPRYQATSIPMAIVQPPTTPTPTLLSKPALAPAATPAWWAPMPTPIPYPTRPTAKIEIAQANFDLSQADPAAPEGINPLIQYTPTGGSSVFTCHHPYDFVVEKNDLGFLTSLPAGQLEPNMLFYIYSCGWLPGEAVFLTVQFPDGQVYQQDILYPEEALARFANAEGKVYRNYRSQLTDPPGAYTFILSGSKSGREMHQTVLLSPWGGPRARVEFTDPWSRQQITGYQLYGFWPDENVRALAYQLEGDGHSGRLVGWDSYLADVHGWLHVAVDPQNTTVDYLFVGEKSGQALNSFTRGGIAPTVQGTNPPGSSPAGVIVLQWCAALGWISLMKVFLSHRD